MLLGRRDEAVLNAAFEKFCQRQCILPISNTPDTPSSTPPHTAEDRDVAATLSAASRQPTTSNPAAPRPSTPAGTPLGVRVLLQDAGYQSSLSVVRRTEQIVVKPRGNPIKIHLEFDMCVVWPLGMLN